MRRHGAQNHLGFNPLLIGAAALPRAVCGSASAATCFNPLLIGAAALPR